MKENKRKTAKKPARKVQPVDNSAMPLDDLRAHLRPFRGQIDALDDKIMALLAKRFAIVRRVGELKAAHNFPSYISDRVVEVLEHVAAPNPVKKVLKQYEPIKRMIYQGKGARARALFDRAALPRKEAQIRNQLRREGLWLR